jgi:hypothetical protein
MSNISRAAGRDDVYELVELAYEYKREPEKLEEIAAAIEQSIPRLDPVRQRRELLHVVNAPDFPELAAARDAARTALETAGAGGGAVG